MAKRKASEALERALTATNGLQLWAGKAWRIGVLMVKGAYLVEERKRLLKQLGEEAYRRLRQGEWKADELQSLVHDLDRTHKKIEIEETLIRNTRFGTHGKEGALTDTEARASAPVETPPPTEGLS